METLTDRQFEIVALVAEGRTNIEIGRLLHIAASSVKSHVEVACRKLGAHDRTNLVHRAHLAGYFAGATSVQSRDT